MWGSLIILLLTFVLLPRYYLVTHTLQQKLSSVLNKHNIIQDITKKCCESVYIMWIFWSKLHTSFIIIQGEVELCEYVLTMSLFFSDNYNNQKLKKHMSHEQHILKKKNFLSWQDSHKFCLCHAIASFIMLKIIIMQWLWTGHFSWTNQVCGIMI